MGLLTKPLLLLLLLFPTTILATECFTEHVRDAIEKNQMRQPLYANLSSGLSLPVSSALIRSEEWTIVYSRWMMFITRDLRAAGIPIFCSEFTPMSLTPAFSNEFSGGAPDINDYKESPMDLIEAELNPHIENLNLEMIKSISLKWALQSYREAPKFNCMARHVLESIYATAEAAEYNFAKAREVNLERKTKKFTKSFLKSQVFGFPYLVDIDNKASKVQALGIPIICNDVPPIIDLGSL